MKKVFAWGSNRRFNDYSSYIKNKFGGRVQKISVNVGFSCPNRDGTKGIGGCIYCDNNTFKPGYCEPVIPIKEQIDKGIGFFAKKYTDMRFMAYFQSYTNTYAPVEKLRKMYLEALQHPKVIALVIGTRPDCVNEDILKMLAELNTQWPVTIEFGLESTKNETLKTINRCHTWDESVQAINLCYRYGIDTGGHLILGLPGETEEDILNHAKKVSEWPLSTIKLHQLQVTKNTRLAMEYYANPGFVHLFSFEEYLDLVIRFIELLNPNLVIERFVSTSPLDKLIAPRWNRMKNFEIVALIEKALEKRDTYQGRLF